MRLWNQVIGRGWKSFEVHARRLRDCHEWTFKSSPGEGSERKEDSAEKASIFLENT